MSYTAAVPSPRCKNCAVSHGDVAVYHHAGLLSLNASLSQQCLELAHCPSRTCVFLPSSCGTPNCQEAVALEKIAWMGNGESGSPEHLADEIKTHDFTQRIKSNSRTYYQGITVFPSLEDLLSSQDNKHGRKVAWQLPKQRERVHRKSSRLFLYTWICKKRTSGRR